MARRAQPNLALAVLRPGKDEDQLTELFAGAIALDQELGRFLMGCAGVPVEDGAHVDVITQEVIREDMSRMDMVLTAGGRQVWSEHKIGAVFQPDQLIRYGQHIRRGLVIVPNTRAQDAREEAAAALAALGVGGIHDARIEVLSWEHDVARYLRDDRRVDPNAVTGASSAASKSLADLYGYLEYKDLTMPPKISEDDIQALERCTWVLSIAIPTILAAAKELGKREGLERRDSRIRPPVSWRESDYGWVSFYPPAASWLNEAGGKFELFVGGRAPGMEGAGICAGATLTWKECSPEAREQAMSDEWEETLGQAGLRLIPESWGARAAIVTPLRELDGRDLQEQADNAAESLRRSMAALNQLDDAWARLARDRLAARNADLDD